MCTCVYMYLWTCVQSSIGNYDALLLDLQIDCSFLVCSFHFNKFLTSRRLIFYWKNPFHFHKHWQNFLFLSFPFSFFFYLGKNSSDKTKDKLSKPRKRLNPSMSLPLWVLLSQALIRVPYLFFLAYLPPSRGIHHWTSNYILKVLHTDDIS